MTWDGTAMDEAFAPFAGNVTAFADVLGLFEDAQRIQRFQNIVTEKIMADPE